MPEDTSERYNRIKKTGNTRTAITSANELRIEQTQACWIQDDKSYPTATGFLKKRQYKNANGIEM
jgi:hypothetical protein